MEQGICDACGKVAVLHSCGLCGRRICRDCMSGGICELCLRGKFYENSNVKKTFKE